MTFQEFDRQVVRYLNANLDMRYGQAVYNVLHAVDQDAARAINGTHLDPYYDDTIVPKTYEWLLSQGVLKDGQG